MRPPVLVTRKGRVQVPGSLYAGLQRSGGHAALDHVVPYRLRRPLPRLFQLPAVDVFGFALENVAEHAAGDVVKIFHGEQFLIWLLRQAAFYVRSAIPT